VPDRGDIVWLQFNPQAGHEQAGHRPALISEDPGRASVVLVDQVKSLHWKVRKAVKKGVAPSDLIAETLSKLQALL
jgi:mRNA interferase MazF